MRCRIASHAKLKQETQYRSPVRISGLNTDTATAINKFPRFQNLEILSRVKDRLQYHILEKFGFLWLQSHIALRTEGVSTFQPHQTRHALHFFSRATLKQTMLSELFVLPPKKQ